MKILIILAFLFLVRLFGASICLEDAGDDFGDIAHQAIVYNPWSDQRLHPAKGETLRIISITEPCSAYFTYSGTKRVDVESFCEITFSLRAYPFESREIEGRNQIIGEQQCPLKTQGVCIEMGGIYFRIGALMGSSFFLAQEGEGLEALQLISDIFSTFSDVERIFYSGELINPSECEIQKLQANGFTFKKVPCLQYGGEVFHPVLERADYHRGITTSPVTFYYASQEKEDDDTLEPDMLGFFLRGEKGEILGGLTGCLQLGWHTPTFEGSHLNIVPDLRGKGWGKVLGVECAKILQACGVRVVLVPTHKGLYNTGFYEHLGFKKLLMRDNFPLVGFDQSVYIMRLP